MNLNDFTASLELRDIVNKLVDKRLAELKPAPRWATVQDFSYTTRDARVKLPNDDEYLTVKFSHNLQPQVSQSMIDSGYVGVPDLVKVEGTTNNLWITEIVNSSARMDAPTINNSKATGQQEWYDSAGVRLAKIDSLGLTFYNPDTTVKGIVDGGATGWILVGEESSGTDSAAVGAETVVQTLSGVTWEAGKAYRLEYGSLCSTLLANNFISVNFRKTNLAGAVLAAQGRWPCTAADLPFTFQGHFIFRNTGVDVTTPIALTMVTNTAGGNTCRHRVNSGSPRFMRAWEIGDAASYPNSPVI